MEDNFDKAIKKMLENYEAEYRPSDWSLMEDKIDTDANSNAELDNVMLDGIAYESLHNIDVEYNPEHWDLMKERLNDPYAVRRRLVKYKVAEIALVALFIFTLVQFLPFKKIHRSDIVSNEKVTQNNTTLSSPTHTSKNDLNEVSTPIASDHENTSTSERNDQINKTTTPEFVVNETPIQTSNVSETTLNSISESTTTVFSEKVELEANPIAIDATPSIASNPEEKPSTLNETSNPVSEDLPINTDLMDPVLLKENTYAVPGMEEIIGSKVFTDLKQPIKVRIGMTLGADANFVMTPSIASLPNYVANPRSSKPSDFEPFNQWAPGYSGGLSLGFQYGKWEIETGAMYSSVRYGSRDDSRDRGSFEDGYVRQRFEGTELEVIRLPVALKYNFFEKKKWNVYAYSGASLNMNLETFYSFTTQDLDDSNGSINFTTPTTRIPEEYQQFDRVTFDGVLEGGSFSNNTSLTANIGFGVERYFTPRMSIFLQPNYQHQFTKGLGPQSDQINSISILTGAKVTLKKRKKSKK